MNHKDKERAERQENLNKFNSVTQKVKPENQNQTHNARKEGIAPINQKRQRNEPSFIEQIEDGLFFMLEYTYKNKSDILIYEYQVGETK